MVYYFLLWVVSDTSEREATSAVDWLLVIYITTSDCVSDRYLSPATFFHAQWRSLLHPGGAVFLFSFCRWLRCTRMHRAVLNCSVLRLAVLTHAEQRRLTPVTCHMPVHVVSGVAVLADTVERRVLHSYSQSVSQSVEASFVLCLFPDLLLQTDEMLCMYHLTVMAEPITGSPCPWTPISWPPLRLSLSFPYFITVLNTARLAFARPAALTRAKLGMVFPGCCTPSYSRLSYS